MASTIRLKIRTRLSYEGLDNILGQICRGSYHIGLGGLDTTGSVPRKIMILGFADMEDRERVRHAFAIRGALPAKPPAPVKPGVAA